MSKRLVGLALAAGFVLMVASVFILMKLSQIHSVPAPAPLSPLDEGAPTVESLMTESEARAIAERECIKGGEALTKGSYNPYSHTWWFDANLNTARSGCFPACVVNERNRKAEINWRCTGVLPQ